MRGLIGSRLALETVTASEIAPLTIGSGRVADRSLVAAKFVFETVTASEIAPETIGSGRVAPRSLAGSRLILGTLTGSEVADRSLGGIKLVLGGAAAGEIHDSIKNPGRGVFGLRTIGSPNGTAVSAAGSDHFHSISMKHLPEEAQDAMLETRRKLRALRGKKGAVGREEFEDLVTGLLQVQILVYDDENETGEERRERAKRGEVEEEKHDYGNGPEPRKKKRWNTEMHPDLKGAA